MEGLPLSQDRKTVAAAVERRETLTMNAEQRLHRRHGGPGGPGCDVTAVPIDLKWPDGSLRLAELLDAGPDASEIELLRTVALRLGIQWGHDDSGWWAAVPSDRT